MSRGEAELPRNPARRAAGTGRPVSATPLNYFAPVPESLRTPLAKVTAAAPPMDPEPGGEVPADREADDAKPCAFEGFVNVVGTLLVVATVLLLLIDRVHPIFLAKP